MTRSPFAILITLGFATAAVADGPTLVLRMGTVAPEGTEWARLSHAFSRGVEDSSGGGVRVKWYFGGIAGDEMAELDRLRRGQLDGIAGSAYCERLAPSLRALEVAGTLSSAADAAAVMRALQGAADQELAATPFRALFISLGFGHRALFSRTPVRSLADLRRGRYWVWEFDDVLKRQFADMGIQVVPLPLAEAGRAYDEHRIDGFFAIPQAALAFQFSALVGYYTDLETMFLPGCLVMKTSSLDQVPYRAQVALVDEAAKLKVLFEDAGARMDEQLLGTLFKKQGLKAVPMSAAFREEWFREARASYQRLRGELVPSVAGQHALEQVARGQR